MNGQLSIWDLPQTKRTEPLFEPKQAYIISKDCKGVTHVDPIMFEGMKSVRTWREEHPDRFFIGLE